MNTLLAVLGLTGGELMFVMVAVLVLFGAKKIPEFAKGIGQGIKEFRKASKEVTDEINRSIEDDPTPPPPRAPSPPPPADAVPVSDPSSASQT